MSRSRNAVLNLTLLALCAVPVSAQPPIARMLSTSDSTFMGSAAAYACVTRMRTDSAPATIVYLTNQYRDLTQRPAVLAADLMSQDIAAQMRLLLGAAPDQLPDVTTRLNWLGIRDQIALRLHSDGRAELVDPPADPADRLRAGGAVLAERAVRALQIAGERWPWYGSAAADSFDVWLNFVFPDAMPSASESSNARLMLPVYTTRVPKVADSGPDPSFRNPTAVYPPEAREASAEATVHLGFTVLANGSVDMTSVRDMTGAAANPLFHEAFASAARQSLRTSRFLPLRIGTCGIDTEMLQPFVFTINP